MHVAGDARVMAIIAKSRMLTIGCHPDLFNREVVNGKIGLETVYREVDGVDPPL